MREMLDRYWPWGRGEDAKPRGLRNLRLEEIFPNKEFLNVRVITSFNLFRFHIKI